MQHLSLTEWSFAYRLPIGGRIDAGPISSKWLDRNASREAQQEKYGSPKSSEGYASSDLNGPRSARFRYAAAALGK
jgi:hypothetical protein